MGVGEDGRARAGPGEGRQGNTNDARAVPGGDIIALDGCVGDGFGAEPEPGLIFLQERLHGPVGISRVEHLRRGFGNSNVSG